MKKVLLLTIIIISIATTLNAQISKGSVLLGGNLNFGSNKSESDTYKSDSKSFAFFPLVGMAVKENLVIGIQVGYSHSKSSQDLSSSQEFNSYSSEFLVRKYKLLGKGFYLFGQGGVYYSRNTNETKAPTYLEKVKGWNVGLDFQPGVSYSVSKRFYLEAGLSNMLNISYGESKRNTTPQTNPNFYSKSSGFGFSLV